MATINSINNEISSSAFTIGLGPEYLKRTTNDTVGSYVQFRKVRVTSTITSGDELGKIQWNGYEGTGYYNGAEIMVKSTGTIAAGKIPSYIEFKTKPDTAGAVATRLTIQACGTITIATPTSGNSLDVNGNIVATTTIQGSTVYASGDAGGVISQNAITNVSNTAANSTGVFTIKSKTATSADSVGFLKIYIGATDYYIPFFANAAP